MNPYVDRFLDCGTPRAAFPTKISCFMTFDFEK